MKNRMKQVKSILAAVMILAVLLSLFLPGMAFAEEKEEGEQKAVGHYSLTFFFTPFDSFCRRSRAVTT